MKKNRKKYTIKIQEKRYTQKYNSKKMSRKNLIFFFLKIANHLPPGSVTYFAEVRLLSKIRTTYR